jgi:hypothetical protein
MKRPVLFLAFCIMSCALRLFGWRSGPRPKGYPPSFDRPFWRPMTNGSIESASLAEAIQAAIREARRANP